MLHSSEEGTTDQMGPEKTILAVTYNTNLQEEKN